MNCLSFDMSLLFFVWGRESNSRVDWRWSSEPLEFELSYCVEELECVREWNSFRENRKLNRGWIPFIALEYFWVAIWKIHLSFFQRMRKNFFFFARVNGKSFPLLTTECANTSWHSDAKIRVEGVHGGVVAFFCTSFTSRNHLWACLCAVYAPTLALRHPQTLRGDFSHINALKEFSQSIKNRCRWQQMLKCVYFRILNGNKINMENFLQIFLRVETTTSALISPSHTATFAHRRVTRGGRAGA